MNRMVGLVILILAATALAALEPGESAAVSVQDGQMRSSPGFLSSITETLQYGEIVVVLEVGEGWVRVEARGGDSRGWMHDSALAPPARLNLSGEAIGSSGASSREIALAGRGFNEQIESEYQEQENLDFTVVDRMETYLLPTSELADFLTEIDGDTSFGGGE